MKISSLHWNVLRIIVRRNYTQSSVSIKCHNLHSFKEGVTLMSEYHWNKTNIIFTWLSSRYNPFKEINRIWKNYQNIRTIPPILGNGTLILLYSKVQNHPSRSDIPLYHSNSHNLVPGTEKIYRTLKEIYGIWENYQNIRTIPVIIGNGTFILLYFWVPNHPA